MPTPHDPNWAAKLSGPSTPIHVVRSFDDDAQLVDLVARFFGVGLVHGDAVLMFATPAHLAAICNRLTAVGFDLGVARANLQLHLRDAQSTLDGLMAGGAPDRRRFREVVGDALVFAAGGQRKRVRVFGEMLDLCWRAGDVNGALRLEELWNEFQRERPVDVLLSYAKANEFREGQPANA